MPTPEVRRIRLPAVNLNALDRLYAGLPRVECKKLCQGCCGPVPMTAVEGDRIAVRIGRRHEVVRGHSLDCGLLTDGGLCSVYDIRPLVCRVWGLVREMACPHGCVPERWLSDGEVRELIGKQIEAGRGFTGEAEMLMEQFLIWRSKKGKGD